MTTDLVRVCLDRHSVWRSVRDLRQQNSGKSSKNNKLKHCDVYKIVTFF